MIDDDVFCEQKGREIASLVVAHGEDFFIVSSLLKSLKLDGEDLVL